MNQTPQERARAVVKAYLALNDALRDAASKAPLTDPKGAPTSTSAEFSTYTNLRERFTEHLENDAYWKLLDIVIGGEDE
jgi:hypothetical protein